MDESRYVRLLKSLCDVSEHQHHLCISVNNFWNENFAYVPDSVQFDLKDHWQTPKEFMKNEAGDCEDYAIAKYFTLRDAGANDDMLYLAFCFSWGRPHIVCLFNEWVLDLIDYHVVKMENRPDLQFVYIYNHDVVLAVRGIGSYTKTMIGPDDLSLWKQLRERIENGE